jgi:hypothetical protein
VQDDRYEGHIKLVSAVASGSRVSPKPREPAPGDSVLRNSRRPRFLHLW